MGCSNSTSKSESIIKYAGDLFKVMKSPVVSLARHAQQRLACYIVTRLTCVVSFVSGKNSSSSISESIKSGASESAPDKRLLPRHKLVVLGDTGVGKTCLVVRYVRGMYDSQSRTTIGASFLSHAVPLPDGRSVLFEIWDTAGQERYLSIAPLYYRGAHAAAIVYDVTSESSYKKAKYWVDELRKNAGSGDMVLALVGNKTDKAAAREISTEAASRYAQAENMMFYETSAQSGAGVSSLFVSLAASLAGSLPLSSGALQPANSLSKH